jgi:hypothetical protein
MPEPEITGPSDTSKPGPVIQAGEVTSPVIRVAGYGVSAGFILEGLEQFNVWHGTTGQTKWAMGALTILLTFITNTVEKRKGRRLIGSPS